MDVLSAPVLTADRRIHYGQEQLQFGDLWLPKAAGRRPTPLIVFFHGGWWKAEYDLGYAGYLCRAFRDAGIACWSVEYRRVGDAGGGWPGTFQDAAAGFEYASVLAPEYLLDLSRVLTMGHSAGGQLAFWVAGRQHIPADSVLHEFHVETPVHGAISLAGAVGLRLTIELSGDGEFAHDRQNVYALMGGTPEQVPERYNAGDPASLLPFQAPQVLIQGTADDQIPPQLPERWAALSRRSGSEATVYMLPGLDHFDVVDPTSPAWPVVLEQTRRLLS